MLRETGRQQWQLRLLSGHLSAWRQEISSLRSVDTHDGRRHLPCSFLRLEALDRVDRVIHVRLRCRNEIRGVH